RRKSSKRSNSACVIIASLVHVASESAGRSFVVPICWNAICQLNLPRWRVRGRRSPVFLLGRLIACGRAMRQLSVAVRFWVVDRIPRVQRLRRIGQAEGRQATIYFRFPSNTAVRQGLPLLDTQPLLTRSRHTTARVLLLRDGHGSGCPCR